MLRDLFEPEHEGYLTDPALLDRLATEKLQREAEALRAEGWKWVEIMPEIDYQGIRGMARFHPARASRTRSSRPRSTGSGSFDSLVAEHGEDPPDAVAAEIEASPTGSTRSAPGRPFGTPRISLAPV